MEEVKLKLCWEPTSLQEHNTSGQSEVVDRSRKQGRTRKRLSTKESRRGRGRIQSWANESGVTAPWPGSTVQRFRDGGPPGRAAGPSPPPFFFRYPLPLRTKRHFILWSVIVASVLSPLQPSFWKVRGEEVRARVSRGTNLFSSLLLLSTFFFKCSHSAPPTGCYKQQEYACRHE